MPRPPWQYALNQPIVIWHYLRLTFFPRGLCLHYLGPAPPRSPRWSFRGWRFGASGGHGVVHGSAAGRGVVAGSFFLVLSVTSSVVPVFDMIFEHRMYLSLAAVAVLVVLGGYDVLSYLLPAAAGLPAAAMAARLAHGLDRRCPGGGNL